MESKFDILSKIDIENLSYTDFVSFIKEENRPSGGKNSVREVLKNTFITKDSKVLEVGCTNGFSSLEIARTVGCKVSGIDINENSIAVANERKNKDAKIKDIVSFNVGSAYDIPFENNLFDLIFCGNATSFMDKKSKAISEYKRVVKDWGFIATVPIFYTKDIPESIIKETSNEINAEIKVLKKDDWENMFKEEGFEIYYSKDYKFKFMSKKEIDIYVSYFLEKEHIKNLDTDTKNKIFKRWEKTISTFNENLSYTNFSVMILRKRTEFEEPEAFLIDEVSN